jgi:hypothetical protein
LLNSKSGNDGEKDEKKSENDGEKDEKKSGNEGRENTECQHTR